jgi:hypothetical protein
MSHDKQATTEIGSRVPFELNPQFNSHQNAARGLLRFAARRAAYLIRNERESEGLIGRR